MKTPNNPPIIIIGNGGHARVVTDCLLLNNKKILGFTAPKKEENRFGLPYLGEDMIIEGYSKEDVLLVNGVGKLKDRTKIYNYFTEIGYRFASVIHPNSIISPYANIGEGSQIMAGSVIQAFAKISDNTIINTSCSIDHDCSVGIHSHISPGTSLAGGVTIGEVTHVGAKTVVIENIKVGSYVIVGAGSLILKDVCDNSKVYGVPAKEV
ncbi:acetyltransferase [Litchfieldia salsa]|uniref:UDP-perosamine 4-acetyltransferase n=1 Tax=Litchfieldia salsa TaxID=930152 RepID=A0A1H0WDX8_9BACI|nr:acetyltransferase [Litchfieldia salsa]SDP88788.1 UDP-perosamine 4-acetyltransferase [Litchfieldia salsa]